MDEKRIFGLRKNVFFLGLVSLFNDFSNEMIQSVMPVFMATVLGVPPVAIGAIEGVAYAVASFLRIFSGWLSDRFGRRKAFAVIGYIISVSVRPIYAFASSFSSIVKLRIIDRVGKGFRESPRDALLSESSDHKELGKSFGYHRSMDAIGGIMGPALAVILLPFLGGSYRSLFLIAFAIGLFSIISFFFVSETRKAPVPAKHISRFNTAVFKDNKNFTYFLSAIFIFGMGTLPITLVLLRPLEVGASVFIIPFMYLVFSFTFVIAAIPFGRLSDKIGERLVIPFGFFIALSAYFILALSSSMLLIILAFSLLGVASAATDGVERALVSKLIKPELLATGQGFLHASVGLSSLLSGVLGGLIWTIFGSGYAFIFSAGFSLLGLVFFISVITTKNRHSF